MAIGVDRDDIRRQMVARVSGAVQTTDLIQFLADHRTGDRRTYALLLDLEDVTSMPPESELQRFAGLLCDLASALPRGRAALLASTAGVYEAARQLELWCAAKGVKTVCSFRDRSEAEAWLGEGSATNG